MRRVYINMVCFITMFVLGILLVGDSAIFQTVARSFGVSDVTAYIGFFSCAFFSGMAVIAVISGELAERIGKKNVAGIFSFIVACGSLIVAFASVPEMAICGYVVIGFGFGAVEGLINGIMLDENDSRSSGIMNLTSLFCSAGAVVSPLVINNYLTGGGAWQNIYIVTAFMYVGIGVMFLLMRTTKQRIVRKREGLVSFRFFKNKFFVLACALIFIYIGLEAGATSWAVNIFSDSLGAYSLAVLFVACGVSRFIMSKIEKTKTIYIMIFACIACTALGILGVILFNDNVAVCLEFYALIGFGFGPLWPTFFSFGTDAAGKLTGAGSGMVMMFSSLGGVVLSPVIGMFSGLSILWVCFALALGLAAVQSVFTGLKKRENVSAEKTE